MNLQETKSKRAAQAKLLRCERSSQPFHRFREAAGDLLWRCPQLEAHGLPDAHGNLVGRREFLSSLLDLVCRLLLEKKKISAELAAASLYMRKHNMPSLGTCVSVSYALV